MATVELKSVKIPGIENINLINESEDTICVTIQHNSIYGNDLRSNCTAPVVLNILRNSRGTINAICVEHPEKTLKVSATQILLATRKYTPKLRETTFSVPITPEDIKGFSDHYGITESSLKPLAESFFDYLDSRPKKNLLYLNGDKR